MTPNNIANILKINCPSVPALPIILKPETPAKIINTTIAIPRLVSEAKFNCGLEMDFTSEEESFFCCFLDFPMSFVSEHCLKIIVIIPFLPVVVHIPAFTDLLTIPSIVYIIKRYNIQEVL